MLSGNSYDRNTLVTNADELPQLKRKVYIYTYTFFGMQSQLLSGPWTIDRVGLGFESVCDCFKSFECLLEEVPIAVSHIFLVSGHE